MLISETSSLESDITLAMHVGQCAEERTRIAFRRIDAPAVQQHERSAASAAPFAARPRIRKRGLVIAVLDHGEARRRYVGITLRIESQRTRRRKDGARGMCESAILDALVDAVPERIRKDARNACTFYEPRTTVERETTSSSSSTTGTGSTPSARKAFDDLFK